MPVLLKMLLPYDPDLLGRIGSFWGLDTTNLDSSAMIEALHQAMQDAELAAEVIESLPPNAKEAWCSLAGSQQKITWAQFSRQFGEVREFGAAKREREEPEKHPISAAEMLWYRGLIGRAFMNVPPEPREFVFIPDELLKIIKPHKKSSPIILIDPVPERNIQRTLAADGRVIDHMTDWLACKRMKHKIPASAWQIWPEGESFLTNIAAENGLIDEKGLTDPETLPIFFRQTRSEILLQWINSWVHSGKINDLKALPGLVFDGNWQNDPQRPRIFLLENLQIYQVGAWYSLSALLEAIKTSQPDFQRAGGDYDSWFIHRAEGETYLRGFEHWDEVDGALIKYLLYGPLHWLGLIDLGFGDKKNQAHFFRLTPLIKAYSSGKTSYSSDPKEMPVKVSPDLSFSIPLFASRTLRYQIGRFCEVSAITEKGTSYQITPASLQIAVEGGLKPSQLIQLLEKQNKTPLPKSLLLMVDQWEKHGLEVKIEHLILLKAMRPQIMELIQNNPRTARFIIEKITPTLAVINPAGVKIIQQALIEQGLLAEVKLEP